MARIVLLAAALALLLVSTGCGASDVAEDSVKSQEADTAARIKAKGGEVAESRD